MANVGANILFLGSDKSYFMGKILTKSSVHLTAFALQRLITFCASYIPLSDVHLTATISLYTSFILIYILCGSLPSCKLMLYTYAAETVYHPDY
jgi:hypothetical protein